MPGSGYSDRKTGRWIQKEAAYWHLEFEPCWTIKSPMTRLRGPNHCREVVKYCSSVLVEKKDGSPCKLGPGEAILKIRETAPWTLVTDVEDEKC